MAARSAIEALMSETTERAKLSRRIVRVRIEGRVQGVGFRMFVQREAIARGADGFVRNRRDGGVEAVFAGTSDIIDDLISCCERGPRSSTVQFVKVLDDTIEPARGFVIAPTV
jgi:acylphosphatase